MLLERCCGSFLGAAGLQLTQGAITQACPERSRRDALRRARNTVDTAYQSLQARIRDSPVVYTDDTGWQVGGESAHLIAFDVDMVLVYRVQPRHRDMGRKSAWAYYNQQGIPYCLGRKLMGYVGSNAQGHVYRCVAAKCHLQGEEGTPYCEYVITVQPGDDLRKIGPVARVSAQWKKLFSRRSAVERVNSRLKETRRLQDFCFRRLRKVTAHCLLSVLTLQASAVAQARMGGLVGVRQCLRKVA